MGVPGALVVELSTARIHIPAGFDAGTLRAVLDVLAPGERR
jgi:hypothetical protein